jgi:DNA-binding response OmpR family regulator
MIVSDLAALRDDVNRTIASPDLEIIEAASGPECLALLKEHDVDLVILDCQIGAMGAMAICLELRHEESYGAMEHKAVLMMLDRRPDVFLARRSGAEGWVVKPLDPQRLRRAVRALLHGERFEDDAWRPVTVRVAVPAE